MLFYPFIILRVRLENFGKMGVLYFYGGHGAIVSTGVCGTPNSGANPDGHPRLQKGAGFVLLKFDIINAIC